MGNVIFCMEDDINIRELVIHAFKTVGFQAVGFESSKEFYKTLENETPDLILLDIMLPDEDGLSVLKRLKNTKDWKQIPVIMLTAKTAEYDKVLGLDSGADDYITKPFGVMELISRVKAVLRRSDKETAEVLNIDDLQVNLQTHEVFAKTEQVFLTFKEFELLVYLMKNKGIVLSRDKILDTIWGYKYEGENRTVDVHVGTLRQKLGSCKDMIKTIRGVGYKIGETK